MKVIRKPRPIVTALFWVFTTFTFISGGAWYYTLTGQVSITINVQQPSDQDLVAALIEQSNKEVKLSRN